ncbi:MAG TPA: hypothetical protein VGY98_15705 [Verrucomicrobiae bacterium]|nr:hypothetical protein [Verrucomicrobiae bacterium]
MKLNLKDRPAEWRKTALLSVLGLALISSLLAWRHIISKHAWLGILVGLAVLAIVAALKPRWFRGYHILSMRIGFFVSHWLGRFLLALFFLFILTPVGWGLRLAGKDPLRLKRPANAATYWQDAKEPGPLDRLF